MRQYRPRRMSGWLAAAASAALLGCQPAEPDNVADENAEEPAVNLPSVPLTAAAMERAELLDAVREAASAAASGMDDGAAQRQLDGRPFELRIRFGCRGPSTALADALLGWSFQPERRTLRVRAMPTISSADPVAAEIAGDAVEAVEGFWVPRPWLLQPVCPAAAAVRSAPAEPQAEAEAEEEPAAPAEGAEEDAAGEQEVRPSLRWPKIGIAQFFTATDARTRRRDMRAYEAVTTLEADQPLGSQGFDLVLSGRLRALPGKGVIECVAEDANTPPDCIVSAEFDRVWIEQPETKEIVAEWGSG
jgi:hypothetical protein